jgi:hypothetical protein
MPFIAASKGDPWMPSSTYLNARAIAKEYGDRALARRLGKAFGDDNP